MKCGLCLPHCPTYAKLANEAESPRGRIALIQGWASGQLALTPNLTTHLDRCLTCRACEGACPSLVAYGRISDGAKAARMKTLPRWRRGVRRIRLALLSNSRITTWLGIAARLFDTMGLTGLTKRVGIARLGPLAPYHRLIRPIAASSGKLSYRSPKHPDLELFIGCMGGLAQGRAMEAARHLCEHLGLRVRVSNVRHCCGALLRHNGFPVEAQARHDACTPRDAIPLVGLASACIAELREGEDSCSILEICEFLDGLGILDALVHAPIERRILVHEPCSHRNLLKSTASVYRLLSRIPGLDVQPLPGNAQCCGAAGTYMLEQPVMSQSLLGDKLAALTELAPATVVTTNPGCALHFLAGIEDGGLAIDVRHPVELLLESIQAQNPKHTGA